MLVDFILQNQIKIDFILLLVEGLMKQDLNFLRIDLVYIFILYIVSLLIQESLFKLTYL